VDEIFDEMNKAGEYIDFKDFVHNFYEFNIKTD